MNKYTPPDRSTRVPISSAEPSAERAADFLEHVAGALPIAVAAIPQEGGSAHGATFTLPAQRSELVAWIEGRESQLNLYYSLNAPGTDRPRVGKSGRLAEADVAHIRGVALDLDPGAGALDEERAALFAKAEQAHTDGGELGGPSYVIDSGGGVQLLWLFAEPIAADPAAAAAVKAQARCMGARYGSDAVQSLDHLFRMPFTTNLPNAKKRARGRIAATAAIRNQLGNVHTLEGLRRFGEPLATPVAAAGKKGAIEIKFDRVREAIADPDAMPAGLKSVYHVMAERSRAILETTNGDRSDANYRIAAELIRKHRITDPTDLACLTYALLPDRFDEEEARGRGEEWGAGAIAEALERNWPEPRPEDAFHVVTPEEAEKAGAIIAASAPARRRRKLRVLSRADIRNLRPPTFLIGRHVPEGSLGFLYGAPGSFKSFFAIDLAMHIAYGLPRWHGDRITIPPGARAVYLAREGATGIGRRLDAWEQKHAPGDGLRCRFDLIRDAINLLEGGDVDAIIEGIEDAGSDPVALIVVDTVSRSMPGADENLQKDMTRFVAACDRLKEHFGCTVLCVHHSGKSGDMRGSSVMLGAGDFVFKATKSEAGARGGVLSVNLKCEKMKEAEDGWTETYWLDSVSLGIDDDDKPIASLVPRRAPKVERSAADNQRAQRWARIALSALGDRTEATWSDVWPAVRDVANAEGLVKATSKQHVTPEAAKHLEAPGIDVAGDDGRTATVLMYQEKKGGPWKLRQIVQEAEQETANDEEQDPFQ